MGGHGKPIFRGKVCKILLLITKFHYFVYSHCVTIICAFNLGFSSFFSCYGNPKKTDYNMELFQIVETFLMAILMSQIKKMRI